MMAISTLKSTSNRDVKRVKKEKTKPTKVLVLKKKLVKKDIRNVQKAKKLLNIEDLTLKKTDTKKDLKGNKKEDKSKNIKDPSLKAKKIKEDKSSRKEEQSKNIEGPALKKRKVEKNAKISITEKKLMNTESLIVKKPKVSKVSKQVVKENNLVHTEKQVLTKEKDKKNVKNLEKKEEPTNAQEKTFKKRKVEKVAKVSQKKDKLKKKVGLSVKKLKSKKNIKNVEEENLSSTEDSALIKEKVKDDQKKNKPAKTEGPILLKNKTLKCVKALLKVMENDEQNKKNLLNSEKPPIFLLINSIKIPKVPLYQWRIPLPHSLVSPDDDVALLVKDLKKGRRRDYEDTIHHYEDVLQKHGCTQIKTILPINQIKTEYRQFEMSRRLLNLYDHFLVDGRIAGHMAHLLGKLFRGKRKLPTPVHMYKKDLKAEIDNALKKTSLQIHGNGDSSVTQIGNCSMTAQQITENIVAVSNVLRKDFPGGWENIRSLRIKTPLSLAIPIYMTLKNRNGVKVPVVAPKRPKAYADVEGELSTFTSNVKVILAPDGSVRIQKLGNDDSDDENSGGNEVDSVKKESNEDEEEDEVSLDEDNEATVNESGEEDEGEEDEESLEED